MRKPATPGMEGRKTVVLQGHLEMVPQANIDSDHDFANDPIDAVVEGDWVRARGTTLGVDNGARYWQYWKPPTWPMARWRHCSPATKRSVWMVPLGWGLIGYGEKS